MECLRAQAKAAVISGAVCIIAEIDPIAANKRLEQGWLTELFDNLDDVVSRARIAKDSKEAISIGYLGNIVDLLEKLISESLIPELASDQTSLHTILG